MRIRGLAKAKTCSECGQETAPVRNLTLAGDDVYQCFEILVAGRRIVFHVAKVHGETDVYFVDGKLSRSGSDICLEVE